MKTVYQNAELHLGNGHGYAGTLISSGERIVKIYEGAPRPEDMLSVDRVEDLGGRPVIPGLVEVHTHGRAGYDFNDASAEEMKTMARSYLASGVTSVMPTLASAPFSELCAAADRIASLCTEDISFIGMPPCFLGLHLEGRYLNPEKRGAHAREYLAPLDATELNALLPHFPKRFHISCAPELDSNGDFLRLIREAGGTVGIAHTSATYEDAMRALRNGAVSFTHTYNAMPPLHHREGGAVAAALTSDAYAELIVDRIHVAPEMVKLAYRCKGKDRLVLITDSMQATGCADGVYSIAGLCCIVKDGKALTEDGHLAGSTLSLFTGLLNLMDFCELSLDEALPTVTRNPAEMVGADALVGTLEAGKYANFLILSENGRKIESVIFRGMPI